QITKMASHSHLTGQDDSDIASLHLGDQEPEFVNSFVYIEPMIKTRFAFVNGKALTGCNATVNLDNPSSAIPIVNPFHSHRAELLSGPFIERVNTCEHRVRQGRQCCSSHHEFIAVTPSTFDLNTAI